MFFTATESLATQRSFTAFMDAIRKQEDLAQSQAFSYFGYWLLMARFAHSMVSQPGHRKALEELLAGDLFELEALTLKIESAPADDLTFFVEAYGAGGIPRPAQADFDALVERLTHGLIRTMPLPLMSKVDTLLVSIVAMETTWATPFHEDLDEKTSLTVSGSTAKLLGLYDSVHAGTVMVFAPETTTDLEVFTIQAEAGVSAELVAIAAEEVLQAYRLGTLTLRTPEDRGFGWTIEEVLFEGDGTPATLVRTKSFYCTETAELSLSAAPLGDGQPVIALQKAVAEYSGKGYKAAAVTTFFVRGCLKLEPKAKTLLTTYNFTGERLVVAFSNMLQLPLMHSWVTPR